MNDTRQETKAIHSCVQQHGTTRPVVTPIYQSANFAVASIEEQERVRDSDRFYSRYGNPTCSEAEATIAGLEGAGDALVFGSGMAAITTSILSVVKSGDHIVAPKAVYGSVYYFMERWLPRFGVTATFVDSGDVAAFEAAIGSRTRLMYLESPTNPTLRVTDIAALARVASSHGLLSFIDNTFASPINQHPIRLGVDVVLHSATKFLAGHSDLVCGAVAGDRDFIAHLRHERITLGGILDPHGAFLLTRGLRTLPVRVERHNANALRVAQFLESDRRVSRVFYPFLESHPDHAIACRQMSGGGGVLSFELKGTAAQTTRFVESLRLFALAGSLGAVESLVTVPALTSHAMLTPAQRRQAGISEQLVRLAVGLEHADDLTADLRQALDAAFPVSTSSS